MSAEGVALVRAGTVLAGRYRLEQHIASGGMGEVWRAFDRVLGRTVAVKCLLAAPPDEPSFVDRLRAEARTMATISHPGVVEVYDFGEDPAAGVYLVMKYIDGESLAHTLARAGRLSVEVTMRLVAEAAEALHAAHQKGITHRDVKPGNLLLHPDGGVLLSDFGIARSAGATGQPTSEWLVGTAGYIAPEQASGQPATVRSDIYSLGVVAYRCLAGRLPFAGESPVEVALRHVHDEPPLLPAEVPAPVRAVVERAMAKDPAARWPSGAAFAESARRALVTATPQPPGRRLLLPVAAVLVVAVIATMAVALSRHGDPRAQSLPESPGAGAASPGGGGGVTQTPAVPSATNSVPGSGATNPPPGTGATRPNPGAGTTPPAAPRSLTATPVGPGTIRLRWSDGSADETGFTIINGVTSRNVGANTTTYNWDGLAPGTYTCFKVRAYNASGASAYHPAAEHEWVCLTTPAT